jgi:hypothetical protein
MTYNVARLREYLGLVYDAISKKVRLDLDEIVEVQFEADNVGKSFETAQLRARFTRIFKGEPTSSVIVGISRWSLPDELRGHREVADQMLEVLRTHTVQVKEGEYPMGFDVLKRPVAT